MRRLVVPANPKRASKKMLDKMIIASIEQHGLSFESRDEVEHARKHVKRQLSEGARTKINGEEVGLSTVRWYNLTGNYAKFKGFGEVDYVDERGKKIATQKVRGYREKL